MYLLDTNVISELRKTRPHGAVVAWRRSVDRHQLAIPAVVIGEIQAGVEITRKQDTAKANEIEIWLEQMVDYYQVLSMDAAVFREWARLMTCGPAGLDSDVMIAATARIHRRIIATRNVKHFAHLDVDVFNPFTYSPGETI